MLFIKIGFIMNIHKLKYEYNIIDLGLDPSFPSPFPAHILHSEEELEMSLQLNRFPKITSQKKIIVVLKARGVPR